MGERTMTIKRANFIGVLVLLSIFVLATIWFGAEMTSLRDEVEYLRAIKAQQCTEYTKPSLEVPCLLLEMPAFQNMSLEDVTFDEGTCSSGSVAPYCKICGEDLSTLGRKKLAGLTGGD